MVFTDFLRLLDEWRVDQWNWMGTFKVDRLIYKVTQPAGAWGGFCRRKAYITSLQTFQIVLLSKNYDVAWKIGVWGNFHPRASSLAYKRHAVADVHLVGFCIICSRSSSFHASLSIRENYQRKPDEILRGQNML